MFTIVLDTFMTLTPFPLAGFFSKSVIFELFWPVTFSLLSFFVYITDELLLDMHIIIMTK